VQLDVLVLLVEQVSLVLLAQQVPQAQLVPLALLALWVIQALPAQQV
jgi:hypothetical protein